MRCQTYFGPGGCHELPDDQLPICTDDLPIDQPCRDEGDYDDCEEGFRDIGNGCEPIVGEEPEPVVCTPDGPPCPPCPEGVEAGWCEDEDERQDFDCDDPGMENDPRCKDREPVNGSEEEIEPEVIEEELPEEQEEGPTEEQSTEVGPIEEESEDIVEEEVEEG